MTWRCGDLFPAGPPRVLVVDDGDALGDGLADCLRAAGYDLAYAYSEASMAAAIAAFRPQTVIIATALPVASLAIARRAQAPGVRVVVVAPGAPSLLPAPWLAGIDQVVEASLSRPDLHGTLQALLRQQTAALA